MKFMGSKRRIAKEILPIMLNDRRGRVWVEPFVGGGNMIDRVSGDRLGGDADPNVIDALISIRDFASELPRNNKEFTEDDYNKMKGDEEYFDHRSYAGFAFSYAGKWMGGWCRDGNGLRDYVAEAYRNAQKQSPRIQGVTFDHARYNALAIPENSIIYCDPPYNGTTGYRAPFDHEEFFAWCRTMSQVYGHDVYVSEYNAPEDFEVLWQKGISSSLTRDTGSRTGVEKLFKAPSY